jgi:hypothetical protein
MDFLEELQTLHLSSSVRANHHFLDQTEDTHIRMLLRSNPSSVSLLPQTLLVALELE